MSRVFVVQNQQRKNKDTGKLYPAFNISPAEQFGTIIYLLGPNARPFERVSSDFPEFEATRILREMKMKLRDYSDEDYLLLIGNPCFIGFAVALAAAVNKGKVRVLQWHGISKKYIPVKANLI